MLTIEKPLDLLSVSIENILSYRTDKEFLDLVYNWNKNVLFSLDNFYSIAIIFEGNTVRFKMNPKEIKPDLTIKMGLSTLLDLAYGRLGLVKAVLSRKLRIKGIFKIKTILRFKKIFLDSLLMIAKDPNENYYELMKTRKVLEAT